MPEVNQNPEAQEVEKEMTDIQRAQLLIESEKISRVNEFKVKLDALCAEYNCSIQIDPAKIVLVAL